MVFMVVIFCTFHLYHFYHKYRYTLTPHDIPKFKKKKSILLPVLINLYNAERVVNSVDLDQMLHNAAC